MVSVEKNCCGVSNEPVVRKLTCPENGVSAKKLATARRRSRRRGQDRRGWKLSAGSSSASRSSGRVTSFRTLRRAWRMRHAVSPDRRQSPACRRRSGVGRRSERVRLLAARAAGADARCQQRHRGRTARRSAMRGHAARAGTAPRSICARRCHVAVQVCANEIGTGRQAGKSNRPLASVTVKIVGARRGPRPPRRQRRYPLVANDAREWSRAQPATVRRACGGEHGTRSALCAGDAEEIPQPTGCRLPPTPENWLHLSCWSHFAGHDPRRPAFTIRTTEKFTRGSSDLVVSLSVILISSR